MRKVWASMANEAASKANEAIYMANVAASRAIKSALRATVAASRTNGST